MTEKDLYERALRVWGKQPQMLQAIEEMSELTKEILKNVARGKDNLNELIEEAADVEIMPAEMLLRHRASGGRLQKRQAEND